MAENQLIFVPEKATVDRCIIPHKVILKAVEDIERAKHKDYISKCKVIFNPPATILITPDGKKYVSKVYNENFDPEKGLLMCLAKANGITHLGLKKMIINGKHPDDIPDDEIKERWGK